MTRRGGECRTWIQSATPPGALDETVLCMWREGIDCVMGWTVGAVMTSLVIAVEYTLQTTAMDGGTEEWHPGCAGLFGAVGSPRPPCARGRSTVCCALRRCRRPVTSRRSHSGDGLTIIRPDRRGGRTTGSQYILPRSRHCTSQPHAPTASLILSPLSP